MDLRQVMGLWAPSKSRRIVGSSGIAPKKSEKCALPTRQARAGIVLSSPIIFVRLSKKVLKIASHAPGIRSCILGKIIRHKKFRFCFFKGRFKGLARAKNILIIDDDEEMSAELSEILRDEDYFVDVANDGLAGLDLIKKKSYSVVILDLKMPKVDGFQVLENINSKYPGVKVIVLTGSTVGRKVLNIGIPKETADYQQKILKSADAVMNKPFDIEALLSKIENICGR